ncbi:MAG: toxin-activating lysine-acyltransferase [Hyphomicrobiaceae bacterium]
MVTTPIGPRHEAPLNAGRLDDDYKALGLAVTLMMGEPSFARLPFGFWSSILVGQIRRKHYLFVSEGKQVNGFLGWARTTEAVAERWLTQRGEISFEESQEGDCILINAWIAKTPATNRYLLDQLRVVGRDGRLVYAKRFYKDGRVRPVRLAVNEAVEGHIQARKPPAR